MGLLIIFNFLIIYKSTRFTHKKTATTDVTVKSSSKASKRKTEMTRTILMVTFIYVALVLPSSILNAYFYPPIVALDEGQMIVNFISVVQFSYSSFNFVILYFSNKLFAQEMKRMLYFGKAKQLNSTTITFENPNPS